MQGSYRQDIDGDLEASQATVGVKQSRFSVLVRTIHYELAEAAA
jgi:hypothetical protein